MCESWRDVRVWLKEHDWKSCIRHKRIWGSNPHLSASIFLAERHGYKRESARGETLARAFSCNRPLCSAYQCTGPDILGRVAERLNAAVSKTVLPVLLVTRVQIPPLPPSIIRVLRDPFFVERGAIGLSIEEGRMKRSSVSLWVRATVRKKRGSHGYDRS